MSVHFSIFRLAKRRNIFAAVAALVFFAVTATAQTTNQNSQATAVAVKATNSTNNAVLMPMIKDYRKAAIGMPADALREAWGKPKVEDKDGFLYELSDNETAQVMIDADKKISTIAVSFAEGKGAPVITDVFGPGVEAKKQANGSTYHMVRYPEAGYWVSYYAGPGDNALVTLTIKKL